MQWLKIDDNAIISMYHSHAYDYPLEECRIHNMYLGALIGLVKDLQHFHYFSSSNTRWLACESINFFSKEAFSVWQELCIWGVPVQRSHTKVEVRTRKQKYALDCLLRNVMPLSHSINIVVKTKLLAVWPHCGYQASKDYEKQSTKWSIVSSLIC